MYYELRSKVSATECHQKICESLDTSTVYYDMAEIWLLKFIVAIFDIEDKQFHFINNFFFDKQVSNISTNRFDRRKAPIFNFQMKTKKVDDKIFSAVIISSTRSIKLFNFNELILKY